MNSLVHVNGKSVLILRAGLSGIFIIAGISHLLKPEQVENRIAEAPYGWLAGFLGDPYILGILSGVALVVFGVTFLLGIFTKWSAIILFAVLIPITVTIQMGHGLLYGPLWKNVALLAGLLFFIINNPKPNSIYNK